MKAYVVATRVRAIRLNTLRKYFRPYNNVLKLNCVVRYRVGELRVVKNLYSSRLRFLLFSLQVIITGQPTGLST